MPVIACKLGFTQQTVGGATYVFNFDEEFGAHVAHVHNLAHAACFLSLEVYQEARSIAEKTITQDMPEKSKQGRPRKAKAALVADEPIEQQDMPEPQEQVKDEA